jgi:hypothetical protein
MRHPRKSLLASAALAASAVLAFAAASSAATYFVSPSGSDSAAGTADAPAKSLARGVALLKPGDMLAIAPGVYQESVTISVKATAEAPVTITGTQGVQIIPSSDDGITVTDSAYVTLQGLGIYGAKGSGLVVTKSENITVRGCGMLDSGRHAVLVTLSDYVSVEACEMRGTRGDAAVLFLSTEHATALDNTITENPSGGIYVIADASVGGDGLATGANIARNKIVRNTAADRDAIRLEGVERSTIASNVIDDNRGGGIIALKGRGAKAGTHNKFASNVIRFTKDNGLFGLRILEGSTRASVADHVIDIAAGPALEVDEASSKGFKSTHNFFPTETGSVTFVWNGQSMDLASWQAVTRQDADSHVARIMDKPAGATLESTAPNVDSTGAPAEAAD